MIATDLYGFTENDIELARGQLEAAFGQPMTPHESSYVSNGEYYAISLPDGISLSLRHNFDSSEQEWSESDFQAYPLILQIEAKNRGDDLRAFLARAVRGVHFLQREVCTSDRRFTRIRHHDGSDVVVFEKDLTKR